MSRLILDEIYLYHIVHIDKVSSIIRTNGLLCDSEIQKHQSLGTTIGMNKIKKRRMEELTLSSYPDLYVGDCVPLYFCPRSIMLYMLYRSNHCDISYDGGQEPILHLVFNMMEVIEWAKKSQYRWVFTDSNAGSSYFNDYCDLSSIDKLNWDAINTNEWKECKDGKQAEFLVERYLPWIFVKEIGVYSDEWHLKVQQILSGTVHRPIIITKRNWYY